MVAFGVALLHTTLRALPLRSPALSKGLVLVGGAFVLARLTGGALAHMTGMFSRNAARKRRLLRKLQAVEVGPRCCRLGCTTLRGVVPCFVVSVTELLHGREAVGWTGRASWSLTGAARGEDAGWRPGAWDQGPA